MFGLHRDIGIDLGTANTLVFVRGRGVVLREPSVVAVDQHTRRILAVGTAAREMLGRTPGHIAAIRPLRDGVIADYATTQAMLKHFIQTVRGTSGVFSARVVICVPAGVTTVEKRAVEEAARESGARQVLLMEEPLAAAIGAGLDIAAPSGSMVVDIGGGTTDVAVLSLGGIVLSRSLRIGGNRFDEAVERHVKREHSIFIGERTAEEIKIQIGTALAGADRGGMEVRGRDAVTGLPKTVRLTSADVLRAIHEPLREITDMVRGVLERTPPELAADILDRGIVLTGGGALLHGLDVHLARETAVPVTVAEDPLSCVALGAGKALESLSTRGAPLTV